MTLRTEEAERIFDETYGGAEGLLSLSTPPSSSSSSQSAPGEAEGCGGEGCASDGREDAAVFFNILIKGYVITIFLSLSLSLAIASLE